MECYERLNRAFSSWQEDSPASLEQRVETLETNVATLTTDVDNIEDALATKQDIISDLSEIRSGAAAGATAVQQTAFEADQARQETEIGVVANAGAKNLFKIREPLTSTRNNVTFVINADGTVDISTTSDGASAQTDLAIGTVDTYEGVTYKLTGCPSGVTGLCSFGSGGTGSVADTGSGALLTPTTSGSRSPFVRVYNGAVITTPVKFYPMIRRAEITDSTFVPYAPTNRELYETKADTSELHAFLPNITSSTTIQEYVNALSKGVYTAFIANVSNPSDSPINANCFVNIYVYSATTAAVELIPLATGEMSRTYTMRKISGTWREWCKFEGTVVS